MSLKTRYRYAQRHSVFLLLALCLFTLVISVYADGETTIPTEEPAGAEVEDVFETPTIPPTLTPQTVELNESESELLPTEEPLSTEESAPTSTVPPTLTPQRMELEEPVELPLIASAPFDNGLDDYPSVDLSAPVGWLQIYTNDSGAYQSDAGALPLMYLGGHVSDGIVEADVSIASGDVSLLVRGYKATLTSEGALSISRESSVLVSTSLTLAPIDWLTLRFEVIGTSLIVKIDDVTILSAIDNSSVLPSGEIGLDVSSGALVRIDNLMLYGNPQPADPQPTAVPSITPTSEPTEVLPTPTSTPCPVPQVNVAFDSFMINGDVKFTIQNVSASGALATIKGFAIHWGGAKNTVGSSLKLLKVTIGGRSADDVPSPVNPNATGMILWESPDIATGGTTTSPTTGESGQAGWVNTLTITAGSTVPVYVDFVGVGSATLSERGVNAPDFYGTSFNLPCEPDGQNVVQVPLLQPTNTPQPTNTLQPTSTPSLPAGCDVQPLSVAELRTAILTGNDAGRSYVICLLPQNTYSVTAPYGDIFGQTAFPAIKGQIVINGYGATIERAANVALFRLFGVWLDGNSHLTLNNVTLKGGKLDFNAGAAIVNVNGKVTLDGVILQNNQATHATDGHGGAIYNYQGILTATNTVFLNNSAAVTGAAVFSWNGSATISQSCILDNTAPGNVEIARRDTAVVTATNNWWGPDGVGSSAGTGVNAANPLPSAPSACANTNVPPTPTATLTPSPTPPIPAGCDTAVYSAATLISAIQTGNAAGGLYTICLAPITYTFTNYNVSFYSEVATPPITGQIVIEGNNAILERDASAAPFRLLAVNETGNLTLKNVTLRGGKLVSNAGAALLLFFGKATLDRVTFENNNVQNPFDGRGGAVYNYHGRVSITNSVFQNNQAGISAAALFSWDGQSSIFGSCILNNTAPDGVEVGMDGSGPVMAFMNWWGSNSGAGNKGGPGVDDYNALSSAPNPCNPSAAPLPEPTSAPFLQVPMNNLVHVLDGSSNDVQINFFWYYELSSPRTYVVQVDDDPAFGSVDYTCTDNEFRNWNRSCSIPNIPAGKYNWRVVINGQSYPQVNKFSISPVPPRAPSPVSPSNYAVINEANPTVSLTWDWGTEAAPAGGPLTYDVQISRRADFTTLTASAANLQSASFVTPPLLNGQYYWRVRANNTYGVVGVWRSPGSIFTVDSGSGPATLTPQPTPQPTVTGPAPISVTSYTLINGATNTDIRPMVENDVLDLRTLPTSTLRIRANTSGTIGNVIFDLNDVVKYSQDAIFEYRLASSWQALPGTYTLKATPYTTANGQAQAGTSLTIHFTVVGYVTSAPTVSNGKTYTRAVLNTGTTIYKDRTYTVTTVDPVLAGADLIQTVNNDKQLTGDSFMTVTLRCPATLYVAYDTRLTAPTWLSSWTQTTLALSATDGSGDPLARAVYSKHFNAGPVTLGANYGTAQSNMYTLIVKGDPSCD